MFFLATLPYLTCHVLFYQNSTSRSVDDGPVAELAMVAPEHPSPVSVLDTSIYREDAPSPVKEILSTPEGNNSVF